MATAPKRLQRMLLKLERYDFDFVYKKGSDMYIAETLSRVKHDGGSKTHAEFEIEREKV